jgi:hypothetical protein
MAASDIPENILKLRSEIALMVQDDPRRPVDRGAPDGVPGLLPIPHNNGGHDNINAMACQTGPFLVSSISSTVFRN